MKTQNTKQTVIEFIPRDKTIPHNDNFGKVFGKVLALEMSGTYRGRLGASPVYDDSGYEDYTRIIGWNIIHDTTPLKEYKCQFRTGVTWRNDIVETNDPDTILDILEDRHGCRVRHLTY